ncbi:hypothetical protein [Legionella impletisoli]|nr:hypothetical protein [Legionella impletisoli]
MDAAVKAAASRRCVSAGTSLYPTCCALSTATTLEASKLNGCCGQSRSK